MGFYCVCCIANTLPAVGNCQHIPSLEKPTGATTQALCYIWPVNGKHTLLLSASPN